MQARIRTCFTSHTCVLLQICVVGVQLLGLGYELLGALPQRPAPQPVATTVMPSPPSSADYTAGVPEAQAAAPADADVGHLSALVDAVSQPLVGGGDGSTRTSGTGNGDRLSSGSWSDSTAGSLDSATGGRGAMASAGRTPAGDPLTLALFIAATEGASDDALGSALMRLPRVRPMALVEEQTFVHLWWDERARDIEVFNSAQEVFNDWVAAARESGRHASFRARACLQQESAGATDCSWVGGSEVQLAGRGLTPAARLEVTGEAFTYPFMQSGEPGDGQRERYPQLSDLLWLSQHARVPTELRVLALWRPPLLALAHSAGRMPPRFFRSQGLPNRLRAVARRVLRGGHAAFSQLRALPPNTARVVDMEALLSDPQRYVAPLSLFMDVPAPQLAEALVAAAAGALEQAAAASAVAAPHAVLARACMLEAKKEVMAGLGEEARRQWWVDEMPRLLRQQGSDDLPALAAQSLLAPQPHWADSAQAALPHGPALGTAAIPGAGGIPPLDAGDAEVLLTHIVNPFFAPEAEHARAVRLTLASLSAARAHALAAGVRVQQLAAVFAADKGVVAALSPDSDVVEVPLTGTLADQLPGVRHPHTLPLLSAILRAGYQHGEGRFLLYSNIDIALQEDAYTQLAGLLVRHPGVPISAVREELERAAPDFGLGDAARRRGRGLPHPGHDLWAFPRSWVPELQLGDVALGISLVATALNLALYARSGCRLTLLSRALSFHVVEGESVVKHKWLQRARRDPLFRETYTAYNCVQVKLQLAAILNASSAFRRCWVGPAVAKSIRGYKCAARVAALPAPKLREAWDAPQPALAKAFPMLVAAAV
jgi:hypothetical protein